KGTFLAEDAITAYSDKEYQSMKRLFADADVFIWLPELHQGNTPAVAKALVEWLDSKRGRAVHFHWASGTYPVGDLPPASADVVDVMYLKALETPPDELERRHDELIRILRSGIVRVTTPEGTDVQFEIRDRPFSKQIGVATRKRMESAHIR